MQLSICLAAIHVSRKTSYLRRKIRRPCRNDWCHFNIRETLLNLRIRLNSDWMIVFCCSDEWCSIWFRAADRHQPFQLRTPNILLLSWRKPELRGWLSAFSSHPSHSWFHLPDPTYLHALRRDCPIRDQPNFVLFLPTALSCNGSSCFCLCFTLYFSDLHEQLSKCYRLTLDKSPDLPPFLPCWSLPKLLHHNFPAQKGRAGSGTSQRRLFLFHFSSATPPPHPSLETVWHLRRDGLSPPEPLLFFKAEHWQEWRAGRGIVVRGGALKRVKSWKMRLENCDTTAKRKAAWGAGRTE